MLTANALRGAIVAVSRSRSPSVLSLAWLLVAAFVENAIGLLFRRATAAAGASSSARGWCKRSLAGRDAYAALVVIFGDRRRP